MPTPMPTLKPTFKVSHPQTKPRVMAASPARDGKRARRPHGCTGKGDLTPGAETSYEHAKDVDSGRGDGSNGGDDGEATGPGVGAGAGVGADDNGDGNGDSDDSSVLELAVSNRSKARAHV
jgi:hypothetical protein